jgi:hypothetical protein
VDLVTFRATYPGLYQEAFDAGRDAELDRVAAHLDLARAASTTPDKGILNGAEPRAMLDFYRVSASSSDERSVAFVRVCQDLGLMPRQPGASPAPSVRSGSTGRSGGPTRDLGDRMADAMGLPPDPLGEPALPPSPASTALPRTLPQSSEPRDRGDRLCDALGLPEVD